MCRCNIGVGFAHKVYLFVGRITASSVTLFFNVRFPPLTVFLSSELAVLSVTLFQGFLFCSPLLSFLLLIVGDAGSANGSGSGGWVYGIFALSITNEADSLVHGCAGAG
jgi:hypothetical protein